MIRILMRPVILLAVLLVAGCVGPQPAHRPETQSQAAPIPTRIVIDDGVVEHEYAPGDPQFRALAGAVAELTAGVTHRARTFYTPARFEAEIAPLPHVTVEYAPSVTLSLAGEDVDVQQLVFAVIDGEPLLLVQPPDAADWSAFLVDEQAAARFRSAVEATISHT